MAGLSLGDSRTAQADAILEGYGSGRGALRRHWARRLDPALSTDFNPIQSHRAEEKLTPGQVVPVDVEIVPTSRIWHPGERLRLEIAGRYIRENWFEPPSWETDNAGRHVVHTGGEYDSYLRIPVIPPRRQLGDDVVR